MANTRAENDANLFSAERYSDSLIATISRSREAISAIWERNGHETPSAQETIRNLHERIDAAFVDFLVLRLGNQELEEKFPIVVEKLEGERLHSFSSNLVFVCFPSEKHPGESYKFVTKLANIRGAGVKDSLQAMDLIGDSAKIVGNFDTADSGYRCRKKRELAEIVRAMSATAQGQGSFPIELLRRTRWGILAEMQRLAPNPALSQPK